MKARPIIEPKRKITKKGNIVYVAVWSVEKSDKYPEGIKYSLALISKNTRVIGYDYHPTEGHHKHYIRKGTLVREKYEFTSIDQTIANFRTDVKRFEKDA